MDVREVRRCGGPGSGSGARLPADLAGYALRNIGGKKMTLDELVDEYESNMRQMYTKTFLDYFDNPRNLGDIINPDGYGEEAGECHDSMSIYLEIKDDYIKDAKFLTDGCAATIVCGSVVTDLAKNKHVSEAKNITAADIIEVLEDLPPENVHCAFLAADTLQKAIKDYYAKKNK